MRSGAVPMVGIYRHGFLPWSETFIADHLLHLRRYAPMILAERLIDGGLKVDRPVHLLHRDDAGRLERMRARLMGQYPHLERSTRGALPDMIHAHFLQDGAKILPFALRTGRPLIVTAHGYDATAHRREQARHSEGLWYLAFRARLIRHSVAIVCVSHWIKDCLRSAGFPEDRLAVVPLGIDLASLPKPVPGLPRRGVLAAGRLVEKKGTRYLLEAWARLPAELRDEPLTIVGDGPLRAALEARAQALGIDARFVGALSREKTLEMMARHRIFAMPSIRARSGDAEGLPLVLMEAQALGMAVVAFDEGPMSEAIRAGRTGLLARTRDAGSLAHQLAALLTNPLRAEAMGICGVGHARSRFDIRDRMAELEDLYDEHLGSRRMAA